MSWLLVTSMIIIGALIFIILEASKFSISTSGSKSAYARDLKELKEDLLAQELMPWNLQELNLLSRKGESELEDTLYHTSESGVLFSIYDEPIVAFARREYKGNERDMTLVRVNNDIISFRNEGDGHVRAFSNNKEVGKLNLSNSQTSLKSSRSTIQIEHMGQTSLLPVLINNEQSLTINSGSTYNKERVLHLIESLNDQQLKPALFLIIFAIVSKRI